jgi:hypothetical protein|uniref:Uncharacterized protein n=1 Tax=Myoviridae sp. ctkfK18 TaxID=2825165 RepID=A0A8S5VGU1_9CAUD|nr:MAG TPA: hypothetical protein [Myoviridae sp. ctkfK18]
MSIFNSISEELSYELSFIEDTEKDYDSYLAVSNESIKLNVYLYDSIGLEDFKDTIKKGAKYIWSLLVKACIGVSNIWRRLIHFITMSKSVLVLKSVDEELKTYEVAHPEIVDENKAFWAGIDFDLMPVATEDVNQGPIEAHLSNTALYRILLLAAVIQPSSDFKKTYSDLTKHVEMKDAINKIINKVNASKAVLLPNSRSVFDLIKVQSSPLENLADQLRRLTESPNINTDVINDWFNSSEIDNSDEYKSMMNVKNLYKKVFPNKDKGVDFIESKLMRVKDANTKNYINKKYKALLLTVMTNIENTFLHRDTQNIIKIYENVKSSIVPVFNKIIKNDANEYNKEVINILKHWVEFINANNLVLSKVGYEIGDLRKSIKNMG